MTTERVRAPVKPPKNWRLKQIEEHLDALAEQAAPVTYAERWHYEANLAQAAAWLAAARQLLPPPSSTRPIAAQPPKDLVMAPHVRFDEKGRRAEVWRPGDAANERFALLKDAVGRDLERAERLLMADMRVGSKLLTFTYPSNAKVPAIEGVPS